MLARTVWSHLRSTRPLAGLNTLLLCLILGCNSGTTTAPQDDTQAIADTTPDKPIPSPPPATPPKSDPQPSPPQPVDANPIDPLPEEPNPESPAPPLPPDETTPPDTVDSGPIEPSDRLAVRVHNHGVPIPGQLLILHTNTQTAYMAIGNSQGVARFDGLDPNQKITFTLVIAANQHGYVPALDAENRDFYPPNYLMTTFVDVYPGNWGINAGSPLKNWRNWNDQYHLNCTPLRMHLAHAPLPTEYVSVRPMAQPPLSKPSADTTVCKPHADNADPSLLLAFAAQGTEVHSRYGIGDTTASSPSEWAINFGYEFDTVLGFGADEQTFFVADFYGIRDNRRYGGNEIFLACPADAPMRILRCPDGQCFEERDCRYNWGEFLSQRNFQLPLAFPMDHYVLSTRVRAPNNNAIRELWLRGNIGATLEISVPPVTLSNAKINQALDHVSWQIDRPDLVDTISLSRTGYATTWNVYLPPERREWQYPTLPSVLENTLRTKEAIYYVNVNGVDFDDLKGYNAFVNAAQKDTWVTSGTGTGGVWDEASVIRQSGIYPSRALTIIRGSRSEIHQHVVVDPKMLNQRERPTPQ